MEAHKVRLYKLDPENNYRVWMPRNSQILCLQEEENGDIFIWAASPVHVGVTVRIFKLLFDGDLWTPGSNLKLVGPVRLNNMGVGPALVFDAGEDE